MKPSNQNSSKQKKLLSESNKGDIELMLSSDEEKKPVKNFFEKAVSNLQKRQTQTKIDHFLQRVKSRSELQNKKKEALQPLKATKVSHNSQSSKNFLNQLAPIASKPLTKEQLIQPLFKKKPDEQKKSNEIIQKPFSEEFLKQFQERRQKRKAQQRLKKQKQKQAQKLQEEERKKAEKKKKLADIETVFGGIFGNKDSQKDEHLKNLDIFNQLNEQDDYEKGISLDDEEIKHKKNQNMVVRKMALEPRQKIPSALIKLLLSFKFQKNLLIPETKRVPNVFDDQMTYKKTFHYLVTNQCIADIHARMKEVEESKAIPIPIRLIKYKKNGEGAVQIQMNEIETTKQQKFALKNFSLSKNRIGIVTNCSYFIMKNFGVPSQSNKRIYAFICLLQTPETKEDLRSDVKAISYFSLPDFQLTLKLLGTHRAYFFDLEKISTHIREYLAISNLYDNQVSGFIYNPPLIEKYQFDLIPEYERDQMSPILNQLQESYNYTQYQSIREMVIRDSGIVLLQGPPGTGKTTSLMGLISAEYYYLKKVCEDDEKQKIMICAPSNAAVDHITKRLACQGLLGQNGESFIPKILRVGIVQTDDPDIRSVYLDEICDRELSQARTSAIKKSKMTLTQVKQKLISITKERNKLKNKKLSELDYQIQDQKLKNKMREYEAMMYENKRQKIEFKKMYAMIEKKLLEEADIILTTLSSSGADKLEKLRGFIGCLIVDEAAQSTEPNLLIALQTGVRKVMLVGDPCQLPSTTISQDSGVTLLNRSLFERFLDCGIKPYFLNIQYRMAPRIREFSSQTFYGGRLIDAGIIETRYKNIQENEKLKVISPFLGRNALFIDVKYGKQSVSKCSYKNNEEAEIVRYLANQFLKKCKLSIGIITPYQAQRKMLSRQIKQDHQTKMKVVKESQASEREEGEEREEVELQKNNEEEDNVLSRLMINTVDSFQGQQKDIIIVSMVRANEKGDIGFMKDERRINVGLTRSRHLLIVIGHGDTLGSNETWDKFLSWTQKQQTYYQIEKEIQLNFGLKKVFNCLNKQEINRKTYSRLSKDIRKEKRKQISREDFGMGKTKKRVKKDILNRLETVRQEHEGEKHEKEIKIEKYFQDSMQIEGPKKTHIKNVSESKQIIQQKRAREEQGANFQQMNKRIKQAEQVMKQNPALAQLFQI